MRFDDRRFVLMATVIAVCAIFIVRLFWLQVADDRWEARAADISERKITVFPSRGLIYDRRGELLVANTPVYDIMVVPREVKEFDTLSLAKLLGVTPRDVHDRLAKARAYSGYKPSEFEKQITADQFAGISLHLHKYPGFYAQSRTLRTYPQRIGAHMLGYLSEVGQKKVEQDPYYRAGDVIGVGGLEQYYERDLRVQAGTEAVTTASIPS